MKRFIFAVAVVMACLFSVGGALANTYTDHVTTAPNGKGDLLVYPVYMASEGIETKITVINTSSTHSVVAKVIFRSQVYSKEVLDFLIYLSPNDMWIGVLKNLNKVAVVSSTDKSGPILNPGEPLRSPVCADDTNQYGYITVVEAWSSNVGALGKSPCSKEVIKAAYDDLQGQTFTKDDTINTLAGSYMISIPAVGWEASDNAVAFKDYDNFNWLNPTFLTTLGDEANSNNNIQELEAAFNKDNIAMPYNSNESDGYTLHVFTFPTKQSADFSSGCSRGSASAYFPADGKVKYSVRMFNNEEATTTDPENPFSPQDPALITMNDELNFKTLPNNIFSYGWADYKFNEGDTPGKNKSLQVLNYNGTPVIPVVIDYCEKGLSIHTPAWSDGVVTDGVSPIVGYQYTSATAVTK